MYTDLLFAVFDYLIFLHINPSSAMFGLVEGSKERLKIQEYSIAQTSLEQIFNQFAAQQEEEKGPAAGLALRNIWFDCRWRHQHRINVISATWGLFLRGLREIWVQWWFIQIAWLLYMKFFFQERNMKNFCDSMQWRCRVCKRCGSGSEQSKWVKMETMTRIWLKEWLSYWFYFIFFLSYLPVTALCANLGKIGPQQINCAEFIIGGCFSLNDREREAATLFSKSISNDFLMLPKNDFYFLNKISDSICLPLAWLDIFTIYNIIAYFIYFCMHCQFSSCSRE